MICNINEDTKSSLTKHKKVNWTRLTEPVKHLSRSLLWKTSTGYSRKQFLQKFPLRRFKGSCIIPTFLMNPTPPTINSSPKSLDLKQNTRLLLNNHLPHPRIKLGRIKIFKTSFRKLSTKICESRIWQAVGGGESSYLRRYDATSTKIEMRLTP